MNTYNTVDINDLVEKQEVHDYRNVLTNIPDNVTIVGSIKNLLIDDYYPNIDLSRVSCKTVTITNQNEKMNIKFPFNMENLYFYESIIDINMEFNSKLIKLGISYSEIISLLGLPDEVEIISFSHSKLEHSIQLPKFSKELRFSECTIRCLYKFPSSLEYLYLIENYIDLLPKFPKSLQELLLEDNNIHWLHKFPKSLKYIYLHLNNLEKLPKLPYNVMLSFSQETEIEPIVYNPTIDFLDNEENQCKMKIKCYEPIIQSQDDYDDHMNFLKRNSRIKRA